MQNENNAVESRDSVEAITLGILEKFEGEDSITKSFLLECFLGAFFGLLARPDVERITGWPPEITVTVFTDRRNELRVCFEAGISAAFQVWEQARHANRGVAH